MTAEPGVTCGAPRDVSVGGVRFRVHEWGAPGRPLALLLHSLAAHSHWWDWVAPLLAERWHVVAFDARGHGGSDHVAPYDFDVYADDAVRIIEMLRPATPPLVVGHSMGGYVAALLAARAPDRVGALVIADILTGWSDALAAMAAKQAERASPEYDSPRQAGERFRLAPPGTIAPEARLRHLGEAGVVERRPGVFGPAFDRRVFLHPPPDPWPFLSAVACPTLVVRGEESTVMDRASAERVAHAVRRGRVAEVPRAHHHLIVDDPEGFLQSGLNALGGGRV